ncbi:hypothetical protein [Variovorax sp. M-6]|uniref:hypothetical protein n=1 Tax=Variovorax sp. M-6 TaxID=3233041 RepID=UPI003F9DD26F
MLDDLHAVTDSFDCAPGGIWAFLGKKTVKTRCTSRNAGGDQISRGIQAAPRPGRHPHPRWRRNGQQVFIDSVHESQRLMYIVDISGIM